MGALLLKRGVADGALRLLDEITQSFEEELRLPVRERGVWYRERTTLLEELSRSLDAFNLSVSRFFSRNPAVSYVTFKHKSLLTWLGH